MVKRLLIGSMAAVLASLGMAAAIAETQVSGAAPAVPASQNAELREELLVMHDELLKDIAKLEALYTKTSRLNEELAARVHELEEQSANCAPALQARGDVTVSAGDKTEGSKTSQTKLNRSYDIQYLQLQQKMQQENRQFTMVSNIMKTKHDAARSAINNIR